MSWNRSWPCDIDTQNGKAGPSGIRRVHRMCPLSKAYCRHVGDRMAPLHHAHNHFWRIRGRRRVTAILQQLATSWILAQRGLIHCTSFYDLTNAFAAVEQTVYLEQDANAYRAEDAYIARANVAGATVTTDIDGERLSFSLGDGALQGHQPIPARFTRVMQPVVDRWQSALGRSAAAVALAVQEPNGARTLDLSTSVLGDGLARKHVAGTVVGMHREIALANRTLDAALAQVGPLQHASRSICRMLSGRGPPA